MNTSKKKEKFFTLPWEDICEKHKSEVYKVNLGLWEFWLSKVPEGYILNSICGSVGTIIAGNTLAEADKNVRRYLKTFFAKKQAKLNKAIEFLQEFSDYQNK